MEKLLEMLSDFSGETRKDAIAKVVLLIKEGVIKRDADLKPWINLHLHTFHSYNYNNWSPARVVLEAWKTGLKYAGTVDFDSLDAVSETLCVGEKLGMNVIGGFESRVFIDEMKDKVINSPNEPGIYYLCGKGFSGVPGEDTDVGRFFRRMKDIAQGRNRKVIEKINGYLKDVEVNYERDVISLTPSGNPTERHITEAYQRRSEEILGEKTDIFWADILKINIEKIRDIRINKRMDFQELLRKTLVKYGGPGYMPPERETFPLFDDVAQMIENAGGVPTGTWLDGTSPGEEKAEEFLELLKSKGIKAVTIIPERNYNIKDSDERAHKIKRLEEFMLTAQKMDMPVVCGTEMNKAGQPFVDNFTSPVLKQYLPYFLSSARIFFS